MSLRLIPYLVFNGNAQEAIEFYEKAFDTKLVFKQEFGEMPANPEFPLPPGTEKRVGHALLKVGETELMFSDTFPGQPHQAGDQVTICISTNDKDQAKRIYEALQPGAQVNLPLQETHFSPAYANLTDKFGVTFQIFTEGQGS